MELNDRHKQILSILHDKKRASVSYLARELFVSEMTIRRDLKMLEGDRLIKRYHGGAVSSDDIMLSPMNLRRFVNDNEKKQLGSKVMKYLCDDITIFLDVSSTCSYIIPHLCKYKNIKVITNSVQVCILLAEYHIPCFLTGGIYDEVEMCLSGFETEEALRNIYPDIAFFSSLGISEDGDITDINAVQTAIRKIVLKNAKTSIFLFTHAKLNKKYTYRLCSSKDAHEIIYL